MTEQDLEDRIAEIAYGIDYGYGRISATRTPAGWAAIDVARSLADEIRRLQKQVEELEESLDSERYDRERL